MQCPTCPEVTLAIADRQGIEIDYCPACRGVWLDRGELDKLIERAADAAPLGRREDEDDDRRQRRDDDRDRRYEPDRAGPKRSKRKSMLSEIFDFG